MFEEKNFRVDGVRECGNSCGATRAGFVYAAFVIDTFARRIVG